MPQQCSNDTGRNRFGQVPMGDWWYHSSVTCSIGDGSKISSSLPRYLDIRDHPGLFVVPLIVAFSLPADFANGILL